VLGVACASILLCAVPARGADFSTWSYKVRIDVPGYEAPVSLSNFPILVVFSSDITNFAYAQFADPANGGDLRFTAADQSTELNYEIEDWDPAGESPVWVQVPALTNQTHIWAYWGRSTATSAPPYTTNGATWSEGYVAVWHLNETSGAHFDSSANDNAGTASNDVNQDVAGIVAGADSFDGTNDWIHVDDHVSLDGMTALTVEAWVYDVGSDSATRGVVSKRDSNGVEQAYALYRSGARKGYNFIGADSPFPFNTSVSASQWHYLAFRYYQMATFGMSQGYLDGDEDSSLTFCVLSSAPATASPLRIGALDPYDNGWLGSIDEVRISGVARTTNWLHATYMTVGAPTTFCSFRPVVSEPPVISTDLPTDVQLTSATLRGTLTSTGGSPTEVYLFWGPEDKGNVTTGWANTVYFGTNTATPSVYYSTNVSVSSNSIYYYRFFATNSSGVSWPDEARYFFTGTFEILIMAPNSRSENAPGPFWFVVFRPRGCSNEPVTVNYAISGTAEAGKDYDALSGSVFVPDNSQGIAFPVNRIDDSAWDEGTETIVLSLIASNAIYPLTDNTNAVAYITENDRMGTDWESRMEIVLSGYDRPSVLTNFPVLLVFNTNLTDFTYAHFASPYGYDLQFLGEDGYQLNYEIEEWDTNGDSYVWVQVPLISGTDTTIRAYWSNDEQTNALPCTTNGSVWTENYVAVWHLDQTNGVEDLRDSTSNAFHGVDSGTTNLPGKISWCQGTTPTNLISLPFFDRPTNMTVSAWICVTNGGSIIHWNNTGDSGYESFNVTGAGELQYHVYQPIVGDRFVTSTGHVADGVFVHVCVVKDKVGQVTLYINGVEDGVGSIGVASGFGWVILASGPAGRVAGAPVTAPRRAEDWIRTGVENQDRNLGAYGTAVWEPWGGTVVFVY
jgi:hypothetical protein